MMAGWRMVDTHCHLQDAAFDPDRQAVLADCRQIGLGVVVPGVDLATSRAALELARPPAAGEDGPWVFALVGIHPHEAAAAGTDWEGPLAELAREPEVVGIGEVGLDYHYDFSPRPVQREVLRRQVALAGGLGLPLSVHSREAEEDTLAALRDAGPAGGVLHCFSGSARFAERLLELGFYLSFSGMITFASAGRLLGLAAEVPLDRLLVETDAPYLSPHPWRGQRNHPRRVMRVAEVLAEARGLAVEALWAAVMANAGRVFPRLAKALPPSP